MPALAPRTNLFNHVFYDILLVAEDPIQELHELDLDPSLARYRGQMAWSPGVDVFSPQLEREFYARFGFTSLASYYLTHPSRAARLIGDGLHSSRLLDVIYLGQLEKAAGAPPYAHSNGFGVWTSVREYLLRWRGSIPVLLMFTAILLARYRRHRRFLHVQLCLIGVAAASFASALIGEGRIDLAKHLFLFSAAVDGIILTNIWLLATLTEVGRSSEGKLKPSSVARA